jgi:hypothetical protein
MAPFISLSSHEIRNFFGNKGNSEKEEKFLQFVYPFLGIGKLLAALL